jgi:hypothetical protein
MKTRQARNLGEFVNVVWRIRRDWKLRKDVELWFRAEDLRHSKTKLRPKLYRPRKSGKIKSVDALLRIEDDLYEEFERCARQLCDLRPESDWDFEWYFLMQHHGATTRLLDWSDGALIALHFAVRDKAQRPKSGSVIYIVDPEWLLEILDADLDKKRAKENWKEYRRDHPEETSDLSDERWEYAYLPDPDDHHKHLPVPDVPVLWDAPHVSRRIAAQRSRFMIFGRDYEWLTNLAETKDACICAITIPRGSINRIKQELRDAGVSESVLYPDLDGLGREIAQAWEARR